MKERPKNMPYSKNHLIELLLGWFEKYGRPPKSREIDGDAEMPNSRTYKNHFGSWNKALLESGIGIPKRRSGMTGKSGELAYRWRGGRIVNDNGYVLVKNKNTFRYEREHRVIIEKHLNRRLKRHEVIHHLNGNKTDNNAQNLVVMTLSEHTRLHHKKKAG